MQKTGRSERRKGGAVCYLHRCVCVEGSRTATITCTLFHDFDRLRVHLSVATNHFHRSFTCLHRCAAHVSARSCALCHPDLALGSTAVLLVVLPEHFLLTGRSCRRFRRKTRPIQGVRYMSGSLFSHPPGRRLLAIGMPFSFTFMHSFCLSF